MIVFFLFRNKSFFDLSVGFVLHIKSSQILNI